MKDQPHAKPGRTHRRGRGRPSKLTQATFDLILNFIRVGAYVETASAAAGIHKQRFYEWLRLGAALRERIEKAKENGEPLPSLSAHERRCADLPDAIEKAAAESELMDITTIKQASANNWQAAAWRLERKNPDKWGRRDFVRQEVSGPEGKPVQAEVTTIPGGQERLAHAYKEKVRRELLSEMKKGGE